MKKNSPKNKAVIGVGSNIDPDNNIRQARASIANEHRLIAESRFIQTEPVGFTNQPAFTNGVWLIETTMTQEELVQSLHDLENHLGRIRTKNKYAPRCIDLDLVVWNGQIMDHDAYVRDFLKHAVLEVCPSLSDQFQSRE